MTLPFALALLLPQAAPAAQDPAPEPILVELQLGRLASRTMQAYRIGDEALIPLIQFFDLAEIRTQPLADGGLLAILQPGNVKLSVLPRAGRLEVDGRRRALQPGEAVFRDGEVYLASRVMGEVLTLIWQISWPDLTVSVVDPASLPLARRLLREAMIAARLAPTGTRRPDQVIPLDRQGWDGFVLDYSALAPSSDVLGGGAYSLGAGFDFFGGSLTGTVQTDGPIREGKVRTDIAWQGVWRKSQVLGQVRLGDGISTGPRFRSLRGIALSNAPFVRPALLGDLPYSGTLGPGWKVEAYRGGRLIAFDSVNTLGQYRIDVPLQYGDNPVDFIAYGPFGEMREFNRSHRVSSDLLPGGRFEYALSGGACRTGDCSTTANLDLRYGVGRQWTVSAGVDQFWRGTRPNLFHPYFALSGSIGPALGVQAEYVHDAVLRGALRYEPSPDLLLSAEATRFAPEVTAPILTPEGRHNQLTLTGFFRPIRRFAAFYLDGAFDRFETTAGTFTSARIGSSVQRGEFRLLPSVRFSRGSGGASASRETVLGLSTIILPIQRLGDFLGQIGVRLQVETEPSLKSRSAFAFLSRPIARGLRTEVGATWNRGAGMTGSIFVALDLRAVRANSSVLLPEGQEVSASHYLSGAVLYDSRMREVTLDAGPAESRGGLAGRVFLDGNGDGRYDAREYVLPDVRLTVGISSTRSNREGLYRIWNVNPFEPTLISVDTTTLSSPLWVPGFGSLEIETGPNRFRPLNVPIVMGGIVEGTVVKESPDGELPVPAAQVVLRHRRTRIARVVTTFSDGTFYALGVRPGDYEVVLHPSTARALRLTAIPMPFTLPATLEGATVGNLKLVTREGGPSPE